MPWQSTITSKWFFKGWTQSHLVPFVFGVAMITFGCTSAQLQKTAEVIDKTIIPATTQPLQLAMTVQAATSPGNPVHTVASYILAVSGAILALERLISGGLKVAAGSGGNITPLMVAMPGLIADALANQATTTQTSPVVPPQPTVKT